MKKKKGTHPNQYRINKRNGIISVNFPICDDNHVIKMQAPGEAWATLGVHYLKSPELLGEIIYTQFVLPAMMEDLPKKKSPQLVNVIQGESARLFVFVSYWRNKSFQKWPKYLQDAIGMLEQESGVAKEMFSASDVTRLCIEKIYGNIAQPQKKKLRPFDEPDNFQKTYIAPGRPDIMKRILIDGKSPEEIKNLPVEDPALRKVFKALRLL